MRGKSVGTLCFAIVMGFSLTGITAAGALDDPAQSGWEIATLIEDDDAGSGLFPQVAVDDSGNAIAVWQQHDGVRNNIWSNRFTIGAGWGEATLIETNDSGDAINPQVAIDDNGNAIAVWQQADLIRPRIWSNRYVAGTGWEGATLIEDGNSEGAFNPQIAVDGSGDAIVVWEQDEGTYNNIYSNRYIAGTGWGTATCVDADIEWFEDATNPRVAVDDSGNAIAVWEKYDFVQVGIWSNRFTAGVGWGSALPIDDSDSGNSDKPQVAVDGSGNAVAVWGQSDGIGSSICSNRYSVGTGWGSAEFIETDDSGYASVPQIAVDGSGNATVVWTWHDGTRYSVHSNRYVVGTGWGTTTPIDNDDSGGKYMPHVAVDGFGNAVAVWERLNDTRSSIWSNRYAAEDGWEDATLIGDDGSGSAGGPRVAVSSSGNATAVWWEYVGDRHDIWSNRYVHSTTSDPDPEDDGKGFLESYGPAIGVVALIAIAAVSFVILKGRKGGALPDGGEEVRRSEPGDMDAHR